MKLIDKIKNGSSVLVKIDIYLNSIGIPYLDRDLEVAKPRVQSLRYLVSLSPFMSTLFAIIIEILKSVLVSQFIKETAESRFSISDNSLG